MYRRLLLDYKYRHSAFQIYLCCNICLLCSHRLFFIQLVHLIFELALKHMFLHNYECVAAYVYFLSFWGKWLIIQYGTVDGSWREVLWKILLRQNPVACEPPRSRLQPTELLITYPCRIDLSQRPTLRLPHSWLSPRCFHRTVCQPFRATYFLKLQYRTAYSKRVLSQIVQVTATWKLKRWTRHESPWST